MRRVAFLGGTACRFFFAGEPRQGGDGDKARDERALRPSVGWFDSNFPFPSSAALLPFLGIAAITKIPLLKLRASWTEGSSLRAPLGLEFECPTCAGGNWPHRFQLGLRDQKRWSHPLFRFCGETISEISLFPTIIGENFQGGCPLRAWVKLGRLEYFTLSTRPVRRWENVDFDLFLGQDLAHGRFDDE